MDCHGRAADVFLGVFEDSRSRGRRNRSKYEYSNRHSTDGGGFAAGHFRLQRVAGSLIRCLASIHGFPDGSLDVDADRRSGSGSFGDCDDLYGTPQDLAVGKDRAWTLIKGTVRPGPLIDQAFGDRAVSVDAAITQERPVGAGHVELAQFDGNDENLFAVHAGLCQNFS